MKCGNVMCIYYSEGKCICEDVELDSIGMCSECICVEIDDVLLNKLKKDALERYKTQ